MDIDQSINIKEQTTQNVTNDDHTDVTVSTHYEDIDDTTAVSHNGNLTHFIHSS